MSVRIAITQTRSAYDGTPPSADRLEDVRRANVDHNVALIAAAATRGARAIGLGELFPAPYFALEENPLWFGLAESATDGATVTAVRAAAREHGVIVVAPIYEQAEDGRRFNTAVVVEEDGAILGTYRKMHIPCGTNERASFHETFYYGRGDGGDDAFPVFDTSAGVIAVAICYDRHFEGVMSTLAGRGARLVFCPAVTFGEKSERLWMQEFDVDAARHGVVIAGSNRKGAESPWNVEFFGRSRIVGPDGEYDDLSDHPELVIADVDLDGGADPSGWNLSRDRRPDVYD